ncbi:MAG: helix-turn-helix domain-containing protein, partial [Chlamydiae bacterium]|nr:helix-turn-helix domain-containing protein [Chlamydiota bacterium]
GSEGRNIGELFKQRRLEKNLSLREVESATSIRTGYLSAIEEGQENQFLSRVYMYGFMRQYAGFLGLDFDRLSKEYSLGLSMEKEPMEFAYGIGTLEMGKASAQSSKRWGPAFKVVSLTVLVLLVAWLFGKYLSVW